MTDISTRIRALLADKLNADADNIHEASSLVKDLGADSLDRVDIAMTLEQEFEIEVTDAEVEELDTVKDVIEFISRAV